MQILTLKAFAFFMRCLETKRRKNTFYLILLELNNE